MSYHVLYAGTLHDAECNNPAYNRVRDLRWGLDEYLKQGHPMPTLENIKETHVYICTTTIQDKEDVFESFQGEWANDFLRQAVRDAGASHLSMSVGDILHDVTENELWLVEPLGFTLLK